MVSFFLLSLFDPGDFHPNLWIVALICKLNDRDLVQDTCGSRDRAGAGAEFPPGCSLSN